MSKDYIMGQSPTRKKQEPPRGAPDSRVEKIIKRHDAQMHERGTLHSEWQDLVEVMAPHKYDITTKSTTGDAKTDFIFDYTAVKALSIWKAGLQNGITPVNAPFFEFRTGIQQLDDDPTVQKWQQEVEKVLLATLEKSNFYNKIPDTYEDDGLFAMSIIYSEESETTDVRFKTIRPHTASVYLDADDNPKGIAYVFKMTAENLIEKFGEEAVSQKTRLMIKDKPDSMIEVMHYVGVRAKRNPKKIDAMNMPYESLFIEKSEKRILRESGYKIFPFAITFIDRSEETPYGYSPARRVEPEINIANDVQAMLNESMERKVRPAYLVPEEAEIDYRMGPDQLNYYSGQAPEVVQFPFGDVPEYGLTLLQEHQRNIKDEFFVDIFKTIEQLAPQVTAFAISQAKNERLQLLRPILAVNRDQKVKPIIERVYMILDDKGKIPEPPDVIVEYARLAEEAGDTLELNFNITSTLFRLQTQSQNIEAINAHLGVIGAVVNLDPTFVDNYNLDSIPSILNASYDGDMKLLRDPRERDQIRKQRQEQQAAQQQIQLQMMANAAQQQGGGGEQQA